MCELVSLLLGVTGILPALPSRLIAAGRVNDWDNRSTFVAVGRKPSGVSSIYE